MGLQAESRSSARLRSMIVTRQNGRAELEEFFLRSIEAVKKAVIRRRPAAAAAGRSSPSKGGAAEIDGNRQSVSTRVQSPALGVGAGMSPEQDMPPGGSVSSSTDDPEAAV